MLESQVRVFWTKNLILSYFYLKTCNKYTKNLNKLIVNLKTLLIQSKKN